MTVDPDYWEVRKRLKLAHQAVLASLAELEKSERKRKHMEDYFKELDEIRYGAASILCWYDQ